MINVCYVCKQSLLAPCSGTDSDIPVIAVTMNCILNRSCFSDDTMLIVSSALIEMAYIVPPSSLSSPNPKL